MKICGDCGSEEYFVQDCEVEAMVLMSRTVDNEGNLVSQHDDEIIDSYNNDPDIKDETCEDCKGCDIHEFDEEIELLKFKAIHTKENGEWSEDELDEENRDIAKQITLLRI